MKRKIDLKKLFRLARKERGSALTEFAVTVPLLIFLLFAVLQGTFAMYAYHYTAFAAQQGARFAIVRGATWSEFQSTPCPTSATFTMAYGCTASAAYIQSYVQSLGAINPSNLTINTSDSYIWPPQTPDGASAGCAGATKAKRCMVRVTASYSFNFLPFLPFSNLTMSATSEKAILQ